MLLSNTDICEAGRKFVEGERVLSVGHIIKCGKNVGSHSDIFSILSVCLQTSHLKDKPHEINGEINKTGKILSFKCSCKAGLSGRCKHIIATLLFIYRKDDLDDLSCTDKKCTWNTEQKKVLENYEPAPLLDHDCLKKIKLDKSVEISMSLEIIIKGLIHSNLPNSAITQHISGRHSPVIFQVKSKVTNEEKMAIEIIFKLQDNAIMEMLSRFKIDGVKSCCSQLLNNLAGDFIEISIMTKNHYNCWQRERQYRITGSVCYNLYTYTKNRNADWVIRATFNPKNFKSTYTEYRKKTESEARERFIKCTKLQVFVPGLIVSVLNPWLAYSPDGVIYDKGVPVALLEIKCPYKGKKGDIDKTVKSVIGKCLVMDSENIQLKKNHQYYGQIQLGMIIINAKITYFVIYSSFDKNVFILKVNQDMEFTKKMLIALKKNIMEQCYILHALTNKNVEMTKLPRLTM